ncbi:acetylornithine deacetylase [Sphingomonas carotinifaciens]|uniref:Acetylornithine deacetylase n=1 Tax=Sphingomonas carotinifaciens TaxID=1166323 RepID=A0A1G7K8P1_9SPHN|nr:acetylornithine deacetylase [Sphingomonas carotinifaciens]MBB4085178.1 acetylornithine deacetylase [Sphingomonas carotinifaciens]MWC43794.1 acetylornithine deacetylase [Sphingomonas carotinifaciens]SDF33613.1 acetylornithine deacetylase [Sphingomonas carotinifaciens]
MTPDTLAAEATAILSDLIAIDTTSRESNLALIDYVEDRLAPLGVTGRRVGNADGSKANYYATLGPVVEGGVVLSGHSDVVPVDGQPWTSDPWVLTQRGDRLFGRGTCDMKGYLALALATAPLAMRRDLQRPVHLAFSYDEEVGCLGAPAMIGEIARTLPRPAAVVVGEPTNMEVVAGHKGIATWVVAVTGHEAHSSLTHLGISANMVAVRLMQRLADLAERLATQGDPDGPFCPHHATLTIGQVEGGTAVNILARECRFAFDLRTIPGQDPEAILAPFLRACAEADASLRARFPGAGVEVVRRSLTPSFAPEQNGAAETLARRLAGDNGPVRAVPYAAEAGQFQQAGFSTIICGPGSIEQAHQPDEYIEIDQMQRGAAFMLRLIDALRA